MHAIQVAVHGVYDVLCKGVLLYVCNLLYDSDVVVCNFEANDCLTLPSP